MKWKYSLLKLEHNGQWDIALLYMQNVIEESPDDMDAAICMNYLLMHILEYGYDIDKFEYYQSLAKQYFQESYAKFSDNPEYLFFTGMTAYGSPWFFGLEDEETYGFLEKARALDENNLLYHWGCRSEEERKRDPDRKNLATLILKDKNLRTVLESKGGIGIYLFDHMIQWGENNKEKLFWLLNRYFSGQMDVSILRCFFNDDYAMGLEGDVFSQEEEILFIKLKDLFTTFVELPTTEGFYIKFDFPEDEFRQTAWKLRGTLRNNFEEISNVTNDNGFFSM